MNHPPFAHTLPPPATVDQWEPLEEHLLQVSTLACDFGHKLNLSCLAGLAGRWHDVGKYARQFQSMLFHANSIETHLETLPGKPDHSTAGAVLATESFVSVDPCCGRILAYCIAGHHAGLTNWSTGSDSDLSVRLADSRRKSETSDALDKIPGQLRDLPEMKPLPWRWDDRSAQKRAFQLAFLTRFLFSCLIDADRLATRAFLNSHQSLPDLDSSPTMKELAQSLDAYLAQLAASAKSTPVNRHRARVLTACRNAARRPPGLFSLTVPTGGGKTLSSLAFALDHARENDLQRVIYAIPFTSIIEQNADQFRRAFSDLADRAILEHHSNLEAEKETQWNQLASENWDAPVIVTTNVQLLESIFSAHPSRCRKLHNIAKSVIILDEAQTIPVELLEPTLLALDELIKNYGCTVVLCTATQPALTHADDFKIGLSQAHEIIDQPDQLYQAMKRVEVHHIGKMTDFDLIRRFQETTGSMLCIVSTKAHARDLFNMLPDDTPRYHLSTLMTPEHRSDTIKQIKSHLKAGQACRVISTQLIEAGVDIDFEVVYRAEAGLDSIAQAAGRCNREGQHETGYVYVFETDRNPQTGFLGRSAAIAREVIRHTDDLIGLDAIHRYFDLMYGRHADIWDKYQIMADHRLSMKDGTFSADFRSISEKYRLIKQDVKSIIIDRGNAPSLSEVIARMRNDEFPNRKDRRIIQRHSVQIHQHWYHKLSEAGCIELIAAHRHDDQFPLLRDLKYYHPETGLVLDADPMLDPDPLIY